MQNTPPNPHRSTSVILTPDQRLRVFVSSTLQELFDERVAAREAISRLRLTPVMFELGARPHPPRDLYRAYLAQSHIFVGIYWQKYGWIAPDMTISGLEDEYRLVGDRPRLIYIKGPSPERDPRLTGLLDEIKDAGVSYKPFTSAAELSKLIEDDLSLLLSERFAMSLVDEAESKAQSNDVQPAVSRFDNLPLPTNSLVGRGGDIDAITDLLLRGEVRLVTLTGPGGIGKTRLSVEVARRVMDRFADGACFVSLANARDADGVASAISAEMRMSDAAGTTDLRPVREKVQEALREKRLLLVLDNFEQALSAAPYVSELLAGAPGLEILVSSRAMLHIQAEHGYDVKPLAVPPANTLTTAQSLAQCEAAKLFVERARAAKVDFALTDANAAAVAEIVRKLDGLPLAIELAAARVRMLTPQALLTRLDSALQTLTSGARDLPERQQTLRNTLDWSYGLLTSEEQRLFARFSIVESGCTFEAAQDVCCAPPLTDVFDGLASLVDKSLIRQADVNGEPRFSMLQIIREYAEEKLQAGGEAEMMRKLHADYYNRMVIAAQKQMRTPAESAWLARLDQERDNVQAAVRSFLADGQVEIAAHIAWTLWHFWVANTNLAEWERWTETMLSALSGESSARAKAITLRGNIAVWQGEADHGIALIQEGADMFGRLGKIEHQSEAMMMLGLALLNKGDVIAATQAMERGLGLTPNSLERR